MSARDHRREVDRRAGPQGGRRRRRRLGRGGPRAARPRDGARRRGPRLGRLRGRQAEGHEGGRHARLRPPAARPTRRRPRSRRCCASSTPTRAVSGILLQLPTPGHIDGNGLTWMIDPAKDVDGLTPVSAGLLAKGRPGLRPCTPAGCMELLDRHDVALEGAEAVVIGRSDLVGKPVAQMLLARNAHRDRLPLAHARPARRLPARRRAHRRRRAPAHGPGRLGQGGRDRDRRRHQPRRGGARRRRRLRRGLRARGADHAGPARRRPDDDRDAAAATRSQAAKAQAAAP